MRAHVLKYTTPRRVIEVDFNAFDGVAVKTTVNAFEKREPSDDPVLTAIASDWDQISSPTWRPLPPEVIRNAYASIFDLTLDVGAIAISKKVQAAGTLIGAEFDLSFGLKTGDDSRFIGCAQETEFHRRLLRGENIHEFRLSFAGEYVDYRPDEMIAHRSTARPGSASRFERPKVLVRDTGGRLESAYDDANYYVKDVLIVGHKANDRVALAALCGILNSSLLRYYYERMFPTLHVQIKELASIQIPPPLLVTNKPYEVKRLADIVHIAQSASSFSAPIEHIDDIVFRLYGINEPDLQAIVLAHAGRVYKVA